MKNIQAKHIRSTFLLCVYILAFIYLPGINYAQNAVSSDSLVMQVDGKEIDNIDFLSSYLQIPSNPGNEKKAGQFLKSFCEQNDLFINQLGDEEGNYNFAASLYPLESKKPNIIFLNHIDAVPPGSSSDWEHPPFQGHISDGEIWGRGALDMKGVAVAQLFSLLRFKSEIDDSDFEYNITFLAVSAEEIVSNNGASYIVNNYFDLLNPVVVFSEGPPGMNGVIKADREQTVFGISVTDKKPVGIKLQLRQNTFAHGASAPANYPAKDLSLAVARLLTSKSEFIYNDTNIGMIKSLGELENGIMSIVMRYPRLFKPLISSYIRRDSQMMIFFSNTITLVDYKTVSHSANSIPQCIECRLDCRLLPEQNTQEFIQSIRKRIKNPKIDIIIVDSLPGAKASSTNNVFYLKYREAILQNFPSSNVVPAILPGYSDCIHFRCKGVPAYGSHPFMLSRDLLATFHNFNERLPISALNQGTKIYYDFLLGLTQE